MSDLNKNIEQIAKEAFNEQLPVPPANIKKSLNKTIFGGSTYWLIGIFSLLLVVGLAFGVFMKDQMNLDENQISTLNNYKLTSIAEANSDFSYNYTLNHSPSVQLNADKFVQGNEMVRGTTTSHISHEKLKNNNSNNSKSDSRHISQLSMKSTAIQDENLLKSIKKALDGDQKVTSVESWITKVEKTTRESGSNDSWGHPTHIEPREVAMSARVNDASTGTENVVGTSSSVEQTVGKSTNEKVISKEKETSLSEEKGELNEIKKLDINRLSIDPLSKSLLTQLNELKFNEDKYKLTPRWELHGTFGVGTQGNFFNEPNASVSPLSAPSYEAGINARVFLRDWHISTGVNYLANQFKENHSSTTITQYQSGTTVEVIIDTIWNQNDTTFDIVIDSMDVPVFSNLIVEEKKTVLHRLNTIAIPLKFGYRFRFNKFHLFLGAGVQLNVPISANTKVLSGGEFEYAYSSVKSSPYNTVSAQLLLESEFHYRFNDKWSVSLRPSYRYQLSPVFKSSAFYNRRKHSGFLNIGLHYYF